MGGPTKEFGDQPQQRMGAVGIGDQRAEIAEPKLPWRRTAVDANCFRIRDKNDQLIATCEDKDKANHIVKLANSHADMLAALKLLTREVELSGNHEATDYGWPKAYQAAKAAIARAEGRTP